MSTPLSFSAFVMNTTSHQVHGAWRLPDAQQHRGSELNLWVDLARTLEAGGFDVMFFADAVGLSGDHRGGWDTFVETGALLPVRDPAAILSALAYATDHLGLAVTGSIIQEHPFHFARKMSTLDAASNGRLAWNIVTTGTPNSWRNFGHGELLEHDERYVMAQEYADVAYKLWEGSWADDALVQDKASGRHADPRKVSKIHHEGRYFQVEGPHLVAPTPQRTPVLFQAGASPAGRRFAAVNAEAQFVAALNPESLAQLVVETRSTLAEQGRDPHDLRFYQGLQFVVGSTADEARRRADEIDLATDIDTNVAFLAGVMGVDLGHHDLDTPIGEIELQGASSLMGWMRQGTAGRELTVRDVGTVYTRGTRIVGTPETIADELSRWRDAGLDGVNMLNAVIPGSYVEFCDHVMPVLRERGLAAPLPTGEPTTLRRRLFDRDRLPASHRAARYRGAFTHFAAARA